MQVLWDSQSSGTVEASSPLSVALVTAEQEFLEEKHTTQAREKGISVEPSTDISHCWALWTWKQANGGTTQPPQVPPAVDALPSSHHAPFHQCRFAHICSALQHAGPIRSTFLTASGSNCKLSSLTIPAIQKWCQASNMETMTKIGSC